ncbi:hypothetical protein [Methanococcoides sp. LMO-2]|uniref:Uncharacterized protein n=1 Tax=Methanococcoides cohabitans TaxID=3136559 RepID=A0ABU9KPA8_9EURY
MDTLTVIGIAIIAFVLIVGFTAMNLKAASSFQKEASGSSVSSQDNARIKGDDGENKADEDKVEDESENENKK